MTFFSVKYVYVMTYILVHMYITCTKCTYVITSKACSNWHWDFRLVSSNQSHFLFWKRLMSNAWYNVTPKKPSARHYHQSISKSPWQNIPSRSLRFYCLSKCIFGLFFLFFIISSKILGLRSISNVFISQI